MTPAVDLTAYDAVILDFDGPMCDLFAGYPAATIAADLKQLLADRDWPADAIPTTDDPHQILRLVRQQAPALTPEVEAALSAGELTAVQSSIETPGLAELIAHLEANHVPIAIASNNNAGAIRWWLQHRGYTVEHVVGRDPENPARMKPAPDLLIEALALLHVEASYAAFLGDATTDAEASAAAGCNFIALANKPHKTQLFQGLDCMLIVTDLRQLLYCRE